MLDTLHWSYLWLLVYIVITILCHHRPLISDSTSCIRYTTAQISLATQEEICSNDNIEEAPLQGWGHIHTLQREILTGPVPYVDYLVLDHLSICKVCQQHHLTDMASISPSASYYNNYLRLTHQAIGLSARAYSNPSGDWQSLHAGP